MQAVLCTSWGPPEKLQLSELEPPQQSPGNVIIDVKAVGLNFADTLLINNKYQYHPELPFSPGGEIAGIVHSAGDYVTCCEPGDRVMAYIGWGGARQQLSVAANMITRLPDSISYEMAAGLAVTYGTTLHALRDRARLKKNETIAILGASGGVGQAAIEIARIIGARIIAVASTDEKLKFCKRYGADLTVNYTTQNLKEALKSLTNGEGVDVIYDCVGGEMSEQALRAIAWQGRFLVVGFASGTIPNIPLNLPLLKSCQIIGVFWSEHVKRNLEMHRSNMSLLLNWCAEGRISPHIHKTWPLEQTATALEAIARRKVKGKAIIKV